jgi:hypothetical protein
MTTLLHIWKLAAIQIMRACRNLDILSVPTAISADDTKVSLS